MNNKIVEELKKEGYKVYKIEPKYAYDNAYYFVITPSDNILYVEKGYYYGWKVALEYIPSNCGTGCSCNKDDEPVEEITLDNIKELEAEGLEFAKKLNAPMYKNSSQWLNKYWDKDNLILL